MFIPEATIRSLTRTILNTRDFCGNEIDAALDAAADAGIPEKYRVKAVRIARFRANAEWNRYKQAAGVPEKYRF